MSRTLRTFRLADDDDLAELFLGQNLPTREQIARHLRSRAVMLPPSISAEFLAERLMTAFLEATPEPREHIEISCWDVDQFRPYRDVNTRLATLPLRTSEQVIKYRLNYLLGELRSASDWGGEDNDIFSAQCRVVGRELTAAFLLKGPSVARPLRLRDCGSNGDQVIRLTESPAALFIVQHVHQITEPVRRQLRMNVEALRARGMEASCAFIDGMQTYRLLDDTTGKDSAP